MSNDWLLAMSNFNKKMNILQIYSGHTCLRVLLVWYRMWQLNRNSITKIMHQIEKYFYYMKFDIEKLHVLQCIHRYHRKKYWFCYERFMSILQRSLISFWLNEKFEAIQKYKEAMCM